MENWLKLIYHNYTSGTEFNNYWYVLENFLDNRFPFTEKDSFRKRLLRFECRIKQDEVHLLIVNQIYNMSAAKDLAELQPRIFREIDNRTDAHDAFASEYARFIKGVKCKEPLTRILNLLYIVRCNSQHGQKILPEEWPEMRERNELIFSLVTPILSKIDQFLLTFYIAKGIFAYGTLQKAPFERFFDYTIERIERVKIKGHLYDLGKFPGWRYQTWGYAQGCILQSPIPYRLDFLNFCDEIEGRAFQRRLTLAYDQNDNAKYLIWAYHYTEEPPITSRIESGIWRGIIRNNVEYKFSSQDPVTCSEALMQRLRNLAS